MSEQTEAAGRPEPIKGFIALMVAVPERDRGDRCNDIAEEYAVEVAEDIPGGCTIWGRYHGQWQANVSGRWLVSRFLKGSPLVAPSGTSGTESRVCQDIAARQSLGIAKYGQTVEQNQLTLREWLQHAYQECLDQAVYLRRAIELIDASECTCESCLRARGDSARWMMVVCSICGNKRCPHAANHKNACTGSNELGQKGSSFESV